MNKNFALFYPQALLDNLLFVTSSLVTIVTDHGIKLVSKCARGINEQLLKNSAADV